MGPNNDLPPSSAQPIGGRTGDEETVPLAVQREQDSGPSVLPTGTPRYHIIEQIGGGGMGVVYKADDTQLLRTVALKFLPPVFTNDLDARQRFIQEAQAASALQHPNICTIHEIGQSADGQMFICMDFYEGETLKQRIRAGTLPIQKVLEIAIQIADGLAEAHRHGLIHRDIKPANILLAPGDRVKIVDFGLAKQRGQAQLTQVGSTMGTPAYMAPEHVRGDELDCRADVWSLGVTLYELLTGTQPFKGGVPSALTNSILNEDPVPVERLRTEVPPELVTVVRKALAKIPEARHADAGDVWKELTRVHEALFAPVGTRAVLVSVGRALRRPVVAVPPRVSD